MGCKQSANGRIRSTDPEESQRPVNPLPQRPQVIERFPYETNNVVEIERPTSRGTIVAESDAEIEYHSLSRMSSFDAWTDESTETIHRLPFGDGATIVLQPSKILGRGGYGVVFLAYLKPGGQRLAVKECLFDESNASMLDALRSEFDTLAKLDHPHIVRVYHFAVEQSRVARIFMEYLPRGSVRRVMKELGGRLSERSAKRIIHQALLGLKYLHDRGFLHRDLKPDNMLVAEDGTVKLSDFGSTKSTLHAASGTTTVVVGTVRYMAPEVISGRYSAASDVWALAASFLELVTGKPPWRESGIEQSIALLFHIGNAREPHHHPVIPRFISESGQRLLQRCFAYNPRRRPTALELIQDAYFASDALALSADRATLPPPSGRSPTPSEFHDGDRYLQAEEWDKLEDDLGDSFADSFESVYE